VVSGGVDVNSQGKARPVVTPSRCTGCGWCVAACPDHLLVLQLHERRKSAELALPQACTGCAKCVPVCNFGAIKMVRQIAMVEWP